MQTLTFTCPQTGRVIDAGINTNDRSLASVRDVTMRLQCRFCGKQHAFAIERGILSQPLYWPSMKLVSARSSLGASAVRERPSTRTGGEASFGCA